MKILNRAVLAAAFFAFLGADAHLSAAAEAGGQEAGHDHPAGVRNDLTLAQASGPRSGPDSPAQTTCPVMVGNRVDHSIFVEHEGKKVYFCCQSCKAAFAGEPEKYLHSLPQFSGETERGRAHGHGFFWGSLVKPFGIATLTLLLATAAFGLLRRRKPRLLLKWHKRLAITTVVVALAHAALVIRLY